MHVLTSRQLASTTPRQRHRGRRFYSSDFDHFGRSDLPGRALDYISFYRSADRMMRNLVEPGDIVLAMTDPPLCSILATRSARKKQAHAVNWLQDHYPEITHELGVPLLKGPIGTGLSYWRDRSLKAAAAVVVGKGMADTLSKRGLKPHQIKVIHNWTDDADIVPISHQQNRLRELWGLDDKFVVGYSGNLGRPHEFETILAASELLRHDPRIIFLFVGSGHLHDQLGKLVKSRGLTSNFRFFPYQERAQLKYSLAVPDLHWVSLKPALEGLIVPSKFYGIAAAGGKPIIAITAANGEIANLVRNHNCGHVIEPGRGEELAPAIVELSNNAKLLAAM